MLKLGRLLQQYVVDNYVKIETERLRWMRRNQNIIRFEIYEGLQDALHDGENNVGIKFNNFFICYRYLDRGQYLCHRLWVVNEI